MQSVSFGNNVINFCCVGELTSLQVGKTKVLLHDRNVHESDSGLSFPAAIVHVVNPVRIVLNILPHRNWAILLSEHHDITAEIYSEYDKS